jgi:hypothetical protein
LGAGRSLEAADPADRYWLRTDYLVWWTSGVDLPPLVTTSPQGTPDFQAGVLPNATVLYGNQSFGGDGRSGFHTTLGMWLDACHNWSLELDYLWLEHATDGFSQTSAGDPILARPFFNTQTGQQGSRLIAYTGRVAGTVSVETRDQFQSAGALVGYKVCGADFLIGPRYYNLGDRLGISEFVTVTQPGPAENTTFLIRDDFYANNDFWGVDLGFRTRLERGRWSLDILAKAALGNTHRTVNIDGQTVVTAPNQPPATQTGGILAVGTNSGNYQSDSFTMIPQLGLELGCQVNCNWRVYFGYNILYWACVSRAANQVDLNVDPRNFPPPLAGATPFPAFRDRTSGFWAQGMNVGAEYRF